MTPNIKTERDGLEMVQEGGVWTLFLVESDGTKYTAIATMKDYTAVNTLSAYLEMAPKHANDNAFKCRMCEFMETPE